jgi:2-iminoacetate synthase
MFSSDIEKTIQIAERVGTFPPLPANEFTPLLDKASLGLLSDIELVELINATRSDVNCEIVLEFASSYRRPHDRELLLLPPLYFSSICENTCQYCNFKKDGERLDLSKFKQELSFLLDLGFRSIELVSSQDPKIYLKADGFSPDDQHFHMDSLLPYIRLASRLIKENDGGMLTTNIPPLDIESLKVLRENGLDCFLVWQETFNSGQYRRLHAKEGPKTSQSFRLDSMEYSIAAGIKHLAGAFLKGLYDWRKEEVCMYLFDRYLKTKNGRGFSIIGSPRVKGRFAESPLIRSYGVTNREYEVNIALDRILFDGILWLQTRESFDFNRRLIRRFGGGVILTLVSSTAPGGYAAPAGAEPQFPVFKQDVLDSVTQLEADGFAVRYAWDEQDLLKFQRKIDDRSTENLEEINCAYSPSSSRRP